MHNELWNRPGRITGAYTENSFRSFKSVARIVADIQGGVANVFVESSMDRTVERERLLAQRLTGLLYDFEKFRSDPMGVREGSGGNKRQEQVALSFTDPKEIRLFFEAVNRVQKTMEERVRYLAALTPSQRLGIWAARSTRFFATLAGLTSLGAGDFQGALGWITLWYLTTWVDHPWKAYELNVDRKRLAFLDLMNSKGWAYWGLTLEVPDIRELPTLNRETQEEVFARLASHTDVARRSPLFLPAKSSGQGAVSVDLLMENRDGQTPELHVVIRSFSDRPNYPRRPRREERPALHPELEPALLTGSYLTD